MDTSSFKTKTEIIDKKFPRVNGNNQYKSKTVIALDGGYSSVKGVSPNRVFMFPAFAKKAPDGLEVIGKVDKFDLQFRDNTTGDTWVVGKTAETLMDQSDIESTTDASLYTRYRYDSPVYKVIMATGIALGLIGTGPTDEIFLQTGLPATYKDRDTERLQNALTGHYDISLKVGNNPWAKFVFDLPKENIGVMEQPQGTLCATIYNNGEVTEEGKKILQSKGTIILDIGFGTEDIFSVKSGYKNNHQTYSDTGMKSVFELVTKKIKETDSEADLKIFELQQYLETGVVEYFNPDTFSTEELEFAKYLYDANDELCEKSIKRLMQDYNNLNGYTYLIVTGGTGQSRFGKIKSMLAGLKTIKICPGNSNCPDLSFVYPNVYGYYMFRHAKLMAEFKSMKG